MDSITSWPRCKIKQIISGLLPSLAVKLKRHFMTSPLPIISWISSGTNLTYTEPQNCSPTSRMSRAHSISIRLPACQWSSCLLCDCMQSSKEASQPASMRHALHHVSRVNQEILARSHLTWIAMMLRHWPNGHTRHKNRTCKSRVSSSLECKACGSLNRHAMDPQR